MLTQQGRSSGHLRSLTQEGQVWNGADPTGPASTELLRVFLAAFFSMVFWHRKPRAVGAMDYVSPS